MDQPRVLAIVLAGGRGSRMEVLTEERAKPTLPFGGVFSLLDIVMSNACHSRIDDVWVVLQYNASTVDDVLAHGRPWDLDRNRGGLRVLQPQQGLGSAEDGMASGNTDSLFHFRGLIADFEPELVLVLSADHAYRLDYREVIAAHLGNDAECTIVTTTMGEEEAGNHTLVHTRDGKAGQAQGGRRVSSIEHKPDEAGTTTVATEVFLFDGDVLLEVLQALFDDLSEGEELSDFGEDLLPALVERGRAFTFEHAGYWRDLGRPATYLRAHQDLLADQVDIFDVPDWPMITATPQRPGSQISPEGTVVDSMIAGGCRIHGTVERSVLGPGVIIDAGAHIVDSILMRDVTVRADARIGWSIIDNNVTVGKQAQVGSMTNPKSDDRIRSDDITIVGQNARIDAHAVVAPGTRIHPDRRQRRTDSSP